MNIKQHIPNTITLGNLFCGCLGIYFVLDGFLFTGFWLMIIAAILDFFDGFAARLLKVSGELGAQLDSLADMVTFGVLPAMFMFMMLQTKTENYYIPFIGFFIALMSGYRLAKFNIDTEQTHHFKGLPTPINAVIIASLGLVEGDTFVFSLYLLIAITIVTSLLLISDFPLLALKFKSFGWSENKASFTLIIVSLILISIFQIAAIPLILPIYLLISYLHFKLKII